MTETEYNGISFFRWIARRKLFGVRCRECGALYLPPRPICRECRSTDMEWVPMSGEGKLVTFTTIAVGTSAMEAKGFGRDRHYCCGVVELDEGPKVCAFITGVDVQNPANIKINTPVSVEFPEGEDELSVLTFRAGRSG